MTAYTYLEAQRKLARRLKGQQLAKATAALDRDFNEQIAKNRYAWSDIPRFTPLDVERFVKEGSE